MEHIELIATWTAVSAAGGTLMLVSTEAGPVGAAQEGVPAKETFAVDGLAGDLVVSDYAAMMLPRGKAKSSALRLVIDFDAVGKPMAAISHGVGILVDAWGRENMQSFGLVLVVPQFVPQS